MTAALPIWVLTRPSRLARLIRPPGLTRPIWPLVPPVRLIWLSMLLSRKWLSKLAGRVYTSPGSALDAMWRPYHVSNRKVLKQAVSALLRPDRCQQDNHQGPYHTTP